MATVSSVPVVPARSERFAWHLAKRMSLWLAHGRYRPELLNMQQGSQLGALPRSGQIGGASPWLRAAQGATVVHASKVFAH